MKMDNKKIYYDLSIYSEKIGHEDYEKFFTNLIKTRMPFLGLIDFSDIISLKGIDLVFKRSDKTIKILIKEEDGLSSQTSLLFPFRVNNIGEVETKKGRFSLATYILAKGKVIDFLIKEDIEELRVKIIRFFGSFWAFGNTIDKQGRRGRITIINPTKFFEIDLEKNPEFYIDLLDPVPKTVYIDSKKPIFQQGEAKIGLDNFSPYQHALITGTSGSGKSKLLEILINAVKKQEEDVRVLVIDPHGEFSGVFPNDKTIDFIKNYIEPLDIGKNKSPLITQLVAQLITSTLGGENKYSERVVFYSVHLLASVDELTLENINLLLTDSAKRAEFSSRSDNVEVKRFFDQEFEDIYIHHFNDAILPVINFIGEYLLYVGEDKKLESLENLLENNRISIVSFNPHFFGRKIIRFFAGAIINQMYLLAIEGKLKQPTILVVDEFPVVESKVVKDILAETRKFNLFFYASAQYLGQISKPVLDAMIGNIRNIISFRSTKEDAKILSSMMEIKVEEFFKKRVSPSELEESKKEMFVKLHPRECIVRLFDGKKYMLPMKVATVDVNKWKNGDIFDGDK